MLYPLTVNFFIRGKARQAAFRRMPACPQVGDKVVFNDVRYKVAIVEWCMDEDATSDNSQRVNIEMEPA